MHNEKSHLDLNGQAIVEKIALIVEVRFWGK
jgi:hypothetical protein